ncbi:MAG: metallophosphoesterase [Lentisphaeria bacterium]|nr:metallophosphoesterase [Lentisphaeria bacterium]
MDEKNMCMRVGIISDVQMNTYDQDWGERNLEKAFGMLQSMNIDLLFHVGDLANNTDLEVFDKYLAIKKKYFAEKALPEIFCTGNHEFWTTKDPVSAMKHHTAVCGKLSMKADNPWHEVIHGFDFLSLADENAPAYKEELLEKLKVELDKAVARDRKKPIFLLTHFPPADTMVGSYGSSGSGNLRDLLNQYPQVISFSGHTHDPLENECAIWQKEFTAITTSTLSYVCSSDEKFYNSCNGILPYAREGLQFMMMELCEKNILIHRYHAEDEREIKKDAVWNIPIPFEKENAPYTFEKRLEKAVPPVFPENAKLWIRPDFGFLYLVFEQAFHSDHVHSYLLRIKEKDPQRNVYTDKGEYKYIAPFYRMKANQGGHMVLKLPGEVLQAEKEYLFEVAARDDFGKESKSLQIHYLMPEHVYKEGKILYPVE